MKKLTLLKAFFLLCALIVGSTSVWAADKWVKTDPANLQTGDIVVIVDQTSAACLPNTAVSKAPSAGTTVTFNTDKTEITSNVTATMQWDLTVATSGTTRTYQFSVTSNETTNYLACKDTNNGVAVNGGSETGFDKIFIWDSDYSKLKSSTLTRWIGVYNNQDWRCYNTGDANNIKNTVMAFYKKTSASGPVDPSVTIPSTTVAVDATTAISFPDDLTTISFESDNESVATVSDEGVVTGKTAGSAKITATWTAIENKYNAGSQEFTISVIEATVYNKVTRVGQLVAGNEYILVATNNNMAMGAVNSSNDKIRDKVAVTVSSDQVAITDEAVTVLTLGGSTGEWTFLASDNSEYLALNSSSNEIHSSDDATDDNAKWTITEDFQLQDNNYSRYLRYNSGSPRFACYSSGQQTAVLFVKAGSPEIVNVTIPASGYATLSYGAGLDFASATVTGGDALKAYVIPENNGSTLSLVEKLEAPANTGILLKGTATKTYSIPVKADAAAVGTNLLKAGPTTVPANNETIYLLKSGQFHLASEGTTSAGKAYLELPSAVNARTLTFSFEGGTTSINGVEEIAPVTKTRKVVKNGRLVIETANGEFTIDGARMK